MDYELQNDLDEVEKEMVEEDVASWSAYKREKQREASERMEVIVVTIAFAVVLCVVLASFWMRAQRDEAENADLVEMFEGGAR